MQLTVPAGLVSLFTTYVVVVVLTSMGRNVQTFRVMAVVCLTIAVTCAFYRAKRAETQFAKEYCAWMAVPHILIALFASIAAATWE